MTGDGIFILNYRYNDTTFSTLSNTFIQRPELYGAVETSLRRNPVTALLGPRQCGKTTLARLFAPNPANRFDLESPVDLLRLQPQTRYGVLSSLEGVVVIDEIQQVPELFAELRVIVDDPLCRARFLVTGSASPELVSGTSETLAGRVHFIEAGGFDLLEVGASQWAQLWLRGGFPRSFLIDPSEEEAASREWREDFLKTYVMRDIQRLAGSTLSPETLAQFLKLIAHFHGQFWNRNEAATTLNVDAKTVQRYVDILTGAYLLRLVPPYERNVGKRVRKAHRLYIRDSGLLHSLLRIPDMSALRTHDRCGASWEGFGVEQVLRVLGTSDCYFWRTHAGAEIDLIVPTSRGVFGFEFKASPAPTITRGTHEAKADVGVDELFVIHSGEQEFPLGEKINAVPMSRLGKLKLT